MTPQPFTTTHARAVHNGPAVYCLRHSPSGKEYVGSTVTLRDRLLRHLTQLRNGDHHSIHMQRTWKLSQEFTFYLLEEPSSRDHILHLEQRHIDARSPAMNACKTAGNCAGLQPSAETRRKMSQSRAGVKRRPHSAETIAKLSAAAKKRGLNPEYRMKMSQAKRGKSLSPAHRAKLSAMRAGVPRGPRPRWIVERVAASLRGRKLSAEHSKSISMRMQAYWQRKRDEAALVTADPDGYDTYKHRLLALER